ncbi:LGAT1 acyltransferase, partial [Polyodon spathula]|nr:LGAT1 acyltransferase [Polyodon spathula]
MALMVERARRLGWILLKAVLRFSFMAINNLVAIPSYVLYLIVLQPLRLMDSRTFWHIEGVMFKWLLAMVSSWGWAAGYTGITHMYMFVNSVTDSVKMTTDVWAVSALALFTMQYTVQGMGEAVEEHIVNPTSGIDWLCVTLGGIHKNPWGVVDMGRVMEWGDDVRPISEEAAVVIANHQATGDVCTLMMCLQDKGTVVRKMMWLMDHVFKYTNFGLVSLIHGDFFIRQGKAHRDKQLFLLKDHLDKYYHSRDRKWIVLFPEGGFLRKRRETSQAFSKKYNLPFLKHVTLPRMGATKVILKSLGPQQENGSLGAGDATRSDSAQPSAALKCYCASKSKGLQWVVDITIAYTKARPMDIQTWILAYRPPAVTHVHYRIYPIKDVPVETEPLTNWLYQRFVEKEELLAHFYETGAFPPPEGQKEAVSKEMTLDPVWLFLVQSFAFASGYMWYNVLQYFYYVFF